MTIWAMHGAGLVSLGPTTDAVAVEVPLLRGDGDPRPKVAVIVEEQDDVLAVVDLAHGPTVIGATLAARLGLEVRGRDERRTTIRRLRIGDLILDDLRAEVGYGDELVIGVRALPELSAAILSSEGVVRFVREADADALLASVGPDLPLDEDTVPGSLAGEGGTFRVRTDLAASTVGRSIPGEQVAAGVPEVWALATVGGIDLPAGWWTTDERGASPLVLGELGADGLAFTDLAVAPGRLALAPSVRPRWSDSASVRMAWAEGAAGGWSEPDGEDDLLARARWADLAEARWAAGDAAGALAADRRLALVAGERCELLLAMGERRLRAGLGGLDLLQRAAALWDDRAAAEVHQPSECARAQVLLEPGLGSEGELRLRIERGARLDPAVRTALAAALHRSGRTEPALRWAARASRLRDPHPLTTALGLLEGAGDDALLAGIAADPGWVAGRVVAAARGLPVDGDLGDLVEVLRVSHPGSASAECIAALHDGIGAPALVPDRAEADCLAAALVLADVRGDVVGSRIARDALIARWPELWVESGRPSAFGRRPANVVDPP